MVDGRLTDGTRQEANFTGRRDGSSKGHRLPDADPQRRLDPREAGGRVGPVGVRSRPCLEHVGSLERDARGARAIAILLGLSPKFGALIATIPGPVLGGLSIVMFGLIAVAARVG